MIEGVIQEGTDDVDGKILALLITAYGPSKQDLTHWIGRACTHGTPSIVRALLECGADPCDKDDDETYCLTMAINEGHKEIVELLLKNNQVIEMINEHNESMGCDYFVEHALSVKNNNNQNDDTIQEIIVILQKHAKINHMS